MLEHTMVLMDRWREGIFSLLLLTGIVLLLELLVLRVVEERKMATSLQRVPFSLSLRPEAPDAQVHLLLQTLLGMPLVREVQFLTKEQRFEQERRASPERMALLDDAPNPFVDTARVTLRSSEEFPAFLAFLERPELRGVLNPGVSYEVRRQAEALQHHALSQQQEVRWLLGLLFLSFLLLALILLELVRSRYRAEYTHLTLARLFGASLRAMVQPIALELLLLFVGALLLSGVLAFLLTVLFL
jgi:cell division protein FtsX